MGTLKAEGKLGEGVRCVSGVGLTGAVLARKDSGAFRVGQQACAVVVHAAEHAPLHTRG